MENLKGFVNLPTGFRLSVMKNPVTQLSRLTKRPAVFGTAGQCLEERTDNNTAGPKPAVKTLAPGNVLPHKREFSRDDYLKLLLLMSIAFLLIYAHWSLRSRAPRFTPHALNMQLIKT